MCLNVNLVQLSASNGHVLQSKTKVNMIVCDRSLMKQVLTFFDQWRQLLRDSLYPETVNTKMAIKHVEEVYQRDSLKIAAVQPASNKTSKSRRALSKAKSTSEASLHSKTSVQASNGSRRMNQLL